LKNKYGPVFERLIFNLSEDVLILVVPIHKFVPIDDVPLTFDDLNELNPFESIYQDKAELDVFI
jgi:hypothetical protein